MNLYIYSRARWNLKTFEGIEKIKKGAARG